MEKSSLVEIEDIGEFCSFNEGFNAKQEKFVMPNGNYNFVDLRTLGKKNQTCSNFLATHFLIQANVIVYNQSYIIDQTISNLVSKELKSE
jgi:hypothetical protein